MKKSVYDRINEAIKDEKDKDMLAVIETEITNVASRHTEFILDKDTILSVAEELEDEYNDNERVGMYTITISNSDHEDLYSETFEMNADSFGVLARVPRNNLVTHIDTIKGTILNGRKITTKQDDKAINFMDPFAIFHEIELNSATWSRDEFERMRRCGVGLIYPEGNRLRIASISIDAELPERNDIHDCAVIYIVKQLQNAACNAWKITPYSCNDVKKTVNKIKMIYG